MAHDVFISYTESDKKVADSICSALESNGIKSWIAPRDITPGQSYPRAIVKAIEAAKIMVIVVSSHSNDSRHVLGEVEMAFGENVTLIPFRVENIDPKIDMGYFLKTSQWLDAFDGSMERHIETLVDVARQVIDQPDSSQEAVKSRPEKQMPAEPAPTPAKEPEGKPKTSRSVAYIGGLLFLLIIAVSALNFFTNGSKAEADYSNLRVGILLKNWNGNTTREVFKEFFQSVNEKLKDLNLEHDYAFSTKNIETRGKMEELVAMLKTGEIDLVGELSPRGVYLAREAGEPFVSPMYGGSSTYESVIFISDNSGLLVEDETSAIKAKTWGKIKKNLLEQQAYIAVHDPSSTSGYWYPRSVIIPEFRGRKSFKKASLVMKDDSDIFSAVGCGVRNVIAGSVAKFRFEKEAGNNGNKQCSDGKRGNLISVQVIPGIPQGAYILRKGLAKQSDLLNALQDIWEERIDSMYNNKVLDSKYKLKRFFPKKWRRVTLQANYKPTNEVFELVDPVDEKPIRKQRTIVVASALIMVLVSFMYLFVKRRHDA